MSLLPISERTDSPSPIKFKQPSVIPSENPRDIERLSLSLNKMMMRPISAPASLVTRATPISRPKPRHLARPGTLPETRQLPTPVAHFRLPPPELQEDDPSSPAQQADNKGKARAPLPPPSHREAPRDHHPLALLVRPTPALLPPPPPFVARPPARATPPSPLLLAEPKKKRIRGKGVPIIIPQPAPLELQRLGPAIEPAPPRPDPEKQHADPVIKPVPIRKRKIKLRRSPLGQQTSLRRVLKQIPAYIKKAAQVDPLRIYFPPGERPKDKIRNLLLSELTQKYFVTKVVVENVAPAPRRSTGKKLQKKRPDSLKRVRRTVPAYVRKAHSVDPLRHYIDRESDGKVHLLRRIWPRRASRL